MTNPLVGVWELVSDDWEGIIIYTETHACHLFTAKDRQEFSDEQNRTEGEEAAAFRTLEAAAGTYSVSGSVSTSNMEFHRIPNAAGKPWPVEFTIEGDKLFVESVRHPGLRREFRKIG